MTQPGRLAHLDGLRGLAALYVVFFHVWEASQAAGLPGGWAAATAWLGYGRAAVAVFIVISGYSLSLPLGRPGVDALPGGVARFLVRRARRILPPYYACLVLSWLVVAAIPDGAHLWSAPVWLRGAFDRDVVLSHLLVVHHLSPAWIWKINPPLWSIATEWTIYFVFPAVLIPAWRRGGVALAVAAGFLLGALPGALPYRMSLWWAAPWYLGLFALGMAAAIVVGRPELARLRERVPWGALSLGGALAFVALLDWQRWVHWSQETAVGVATASLLVALGRNEPAPALERLRRFLGSGVAAELGRISYSLYLSHYPLVVLLVPWVPGPDPVTRFGLALLACGAAALLLAQLFFLLFERPTLVAARRDAATAVAPA
jgi:peptidoglycan/LPS O-acetylase OafA/YrhL